MIAGYMISEYEQNYIVLIVYRTNRMKAKGEKC